MPPSTAAMALPALRAYAQVAEDGTTPNLNSGLSVEHLGSGDYMFTLPENLGILDGHELVLIQPKVGSVQDAFTSQYIVVDSRHIEVLIWRCISGGESNLLADSPFNFFLYATTIPSEID